MPFANRTSHLKPEGAYQVLARANQLEASGKEIIHLEIGQPDYPTFANVSEAGIEAIRSGKTRYTPPAGMPSLREALAEDAGRRRGVEVHPDEVVVSPGGKSTCSGMSQWQTEEAACGKVRFYAVAGACVRRFGGSE